jgi:hypothetical protein
MNKKIVVTLMAMVLVLGSTTFSYAEETAVTEAANAVTQAATAVTEIATDGELTSTLNDVLKGIIVGVTSTKDFLMEQLPDVVTQLLWWHGIKSAIIFVWGWLMILGAPVLIYKVSKSIEPNKDRWDGLWVLNVVGDIISLVLGLMILDIGDSLDWLMILVAPKLYLIEYAAQLVQ